MLRQLLRLTHVLPRAGEKQGLRDIYRDTTDGAVILTPSVGHAAGRGSPENA